MLMIEKKQILAKIEKFVKQLNENFSYLDEVVMLYIQENYEVEF